MKNWLMIAAVFSFTIASAQNEFAATAFYNEFSKIYADAQNGFINNKDKPKQAQYPELAAEYTVKFLLPLADSGKIMFPVKGNSYAIYFFEPSRSRLTVDQRGLNLREAVIIAYGNPLYARTETVLQNDKLFSSTYYYTQENEADKKLALFRSSIYQQGAWYYLSFEIRGKRAE